MEESMIIEHDRTSRRLKLQGQAFGASQPCNPRCREVVLHQIQIENQIEIKLGKIKLPEKSNWRYSK
jgi:hypothetical protein